MIAKLPPLVRILSFDLRDDLDETGTLVAHVTCVVENRFVRVLVSRESKSCVLVALVSSHVEKDLGPEARQLVSRRVERLVHWLSREEARDA